MIHIFCNPEHSIFNYTVQATFESNHGQGIASYANRNLWMITFTNLNQPSPLVEISKKAYLKSPEEERMLEAVRELNSGWKKSGSITQNLRYYSENDDDRMI